LIQGYTTPCNAQALRHFLHANGICGAKIHAIDLFDLEAAYSRLGISLPDMDFTIANAAELEAVFAADSFQLVVQDFLLNCAPFSQHEMIISELSRILVEDGLALISFTDDEHANRIAIRTVAEAADCLGVEWDSGAYSLDDLLFTRGPEKGATLLGEMLRDSDSGSFIHVTPPYGNFEFFSAYSKLTEEFQAYGLSLVDGVCVEGVDSHGIQCRRHFCLFRNTKTDARELQPCSISLKNEA
jgi:hypothetical protein